MKINIFKIILVAIFSFSCTLGLVSAQNIQPKKTNKIKEINFEATVKNEIGSLVTDALITVGEGGATYNLNKNGKISLKVKAGTVIIVEAPGFETKYIDAQISTPNNEIILHKNQLFAGQNDKIELPNLIQNDKRYVVGAVSKISGAELESYPDIVTSNALQGKLLGLSAIMTTNGLGDNSADLYIRGLHRDGGNNIVTIVDGVERSIDMLLPEEIASVEVLKDATSKILYGPRAANGVLLITTKRGEKFKRILKVDVEYGVQLPTSLPKYLNSFEYATLYNEARTNDGLSPFYSAADLNGYKNSTGPNDLRYPNVDFYNYFMNKQSEFRKADFEFSGGNNLARYAFIGGYNGNSGLQKVGNIPQRDRFSARGNLDMKVNDNISAYIGIAGVFDITNRSSINESATYTALSTNRPNEYPLIIDKNIIPTDSLGFPALGVSNSGKPNLLNSLMYNGTQRNENINGQLNFGLNFDLNNILKGLSAKAQVTFDNYFTASVVSSSNAPTYSQRWITKPNGSDSLILTMQSMANKSSYNSLTSSSTYNTKTYLGTLNYKNVFNNVHSISVDLVTNYSKTEMTGFSQDLIFKNNALRINYVNNNKYIVELDGAYMGSNKYVGSNQYTPSIAGGVGWILSEENFMKKLSFVDYLKIKGSAGIIAYDGQTGYNNYRDRWNDNGTVRINNSLTPSLITFTQVGNPNLTWEKSKEINLGVEALLFNKKVWVEANYFNELRYDIVQLQNNLNPGMFGGLLPYNNWGKVSNSGVEAEIKYSDKIGNLFFQVGGNVLFSKNKLLQANVIDYPGDASRIGKSTDAMIGYVAEGLFGKDIPLAGHATQQFGKYQVGDIAYKDLNGDGVINELDQKQLGNNFPSTQLGIDLNLNYKGLALYVLGTSQLGFSTWLNNSYYWVNGEDKYSQFTLNRYDPILNPTGTFPRLTTTSSSNNFRNSSFWLQSADFFRLKNVEISYTFKHLNQLGVNQIKLYARGSNLFQISKIKDLDPEVINAGITNCPLMKTYTAGCTICF